MCYDRLLLVELRLVDGLNREQVARFLFTESTRPGSKDSDDRADKHGARGTPRKSSGSRSTSSADSGWSARGEDPVGPTETSLLLKLSPDCQSTTAASPA